MKSFGELNNYIWLPLLGLQFVPIGSRNSVFCLIADLKILYLNVLMKLVPNLVFKLPLFLVTYLGLDSLASRVLAHSSI